MALIIENKLLFIHVPKTGGSYIRSLCSNNFTCKETGSFSTHDHYSITECINNNPDVKKYISFGFVRHPVSWIKSRWSWAIISDFNTKVEKEIDAQQHWLAQCWDLDFQQFIKKYINNGIPYCSQTYIDKLGIDKDDEVDFIFKYENISYDIFNLFNEYNINIDKEKLNLKKRRVGSQGMYVEQTKEIYPSQEYDICEIEAFTINKYYK